MEYKVELRCEGCNAIVNETKEINECDMKPIAHLLEVGGT